ncbi:anhydro-N-acetylmuramic acid kinase [Pseudovibrio axinellae]|uniref:Anhydro-N-acetylmuramic acid kinase n=1 Tax=Pseudovibrio axinellae TaxID=989403 RepID=A0A166AQW6_9HYPH|nr:GNAT family N-acetyltransferase [Pseudovibrio axinellae]KZL21441.1 anhydro-N-acetylmuramic acid kinase [Pseudovibrio axinellae]SER05420.1 Protein N-acetyltransferase, RimJ/RimL family [Pseudovibrio axinellae]
MTFPVLETKRLLARPFTSDDLTDLVGLHNNPSVNRYLNPNNVAWDVATVKARLATYIEAQELLGFSKWHLSTHSGEFVGHAGFSLYEETAEVEMGYTLHEHFWNKGLGSEIAQALVEWFFEKTYYSHLLAFAHPENHASKKVMKRAGFEFRETREVEGMPCEFYQVLSPSCQKLAVPA